MRDDPRDGYEIYTMAAAGGEPMRVTDNEIQDTEPTWSSGGSKIAFIAGGLWTVPSSGGTPTAVISAAIRELDWSPDGAKIAYVAEDTTPVKPGYADYEIWTISASGGTPTDLTDRYDGGYLEQQRPAWSPDGTTIAYDDQHGDLYTVSASGGMPPTKVAAGWNVQSDLDWQPVCTLTGTSSNETLIGTSNRDVICRLAGNDQLKGLAADDVFLVGGGNDTLFGGPGNDHAFGGLGSDTASYRSSSTAVEAVIYTNSAAGEGSDVLLAVENFTGSPLADKLT